MKKALVIYGSTTGNTEYTAEVITRTLKEKELEVILKNVQEAGVDDLAGGYDVTLLGCSTWGDDEIELQDDFAVFFESFEGTSFQGRKVGVFGCGDSSYTHFCGAVDAIEEKVTQLGGEILAGGLKIDGDPEDMFDDIQGWAENVHAALQ